MIYVFLSSGAKRERERFLNVCVAWPQDSTSGWELQGCELDSALSAHPFYVCKCRHLTDFSFGTVVPSIQTLDLEDITNLTWDNLVRHPTPLIAVALVFGVYLFFLPFAYMQDERKRRIRIGKLSRKGRSNENQMKSPQSEILEAEKNGDNRIDSTANLLNTITVPVDQTQEIELSTNKAFNPGEYFIPLILSGLL